MPTKKSTIERVEVQDTWINYYRMATIGLMGALISVVVYIGDGALKRQDAMGADIAGIHSDLTAINDRGTRNREDIKEIKGDLKATQSKVVTVSEAVARLEAGTPQ